MEQEEKRRKDLEKAIIRERLKDVGDTSRGPENQPPEKLIKGKDILGGSNWKLNPAYTTFMADQKKRGDIKTRPVKISDKGLTPARKLSKKEGKIKKSTTIGGTPPGGLGTAKQKEEYKKMMARRRLAKMGKRGAKFAQRKAGGQIKKYGHGGKVGKVAMKKCPRDGIAMRGKTKAKRA